MLKHVLLILLASLLFGCKKEQVVWNSLEDVDITELAADTVFVLEEYRTFPSLHVLDDATLFLTDIHDPYHYRILNLETGKLGEYYYKGESDTLPIADFPDLKASLELFNMGTCTSYRYDMENGKLGVLQNAHLLLDENTPSMGCVKIKEDVYVGIPYYGTRLLKSFKREKGYFEIKEWGEFPLKGGDGTPVYRPYYTGSLSTGNNYLVYGSNQFGYISLYKWEKDKLRTQWERNLLPSQCKVRSNGVVFENGHSQGFEEVRIANNHIYALNYVGITKRSPLKNTITVLDLKGRIVGRFTTHEPMYALAVDSKENYLYTTLLRKKGEKSCIVRYKLPETWQ